MLYYQDIFPHRESVAHDIDFDPNSRWHMMSSMELSDKTSLLDDNSFFIYRPVGTQPYFSVIKGLSVP